MAYYSEQGATIMQGVGSYFDGARAPRPLSFKDGVFGQQVDSPPGALRSFRDGSLGRFFDATDPMSPRSFQDGSLGSYFDANEPAPVARPERYDLDGALMSFRDGSFGRSLPGPEMPGPEEAFEGGIFHALGLPLYIDGHQIDGPLTIRHGNPENTPVPAAGLGQDPEESLVMSVFDQTGVPEGPPRAFREGVLGNRPYEAGYSEGMPSGPPRAFHQGSLGLGAVQAFVIDMTDAQWVKELKTALVVALTNLGITEPLNTIDEDWYVTPYWNGKATGMTRDWANTYQEKINPQASTGLLMVDKGSIAYPTVTGIVAMVAQGVGITAEFTPTNYPKLYALMQKQTELGPDGSLDSFRIVAPYPSEGAKIRQSSVFNVPNLAFYLMGGVSVAAIGVIGYTMFSEKKRKRRVVSSAIVRRRG